MKECLYCKTLGVSYSKAEVLVLPSSPHSFSLVFPHFLRGPKVLRANARVLNESGGNSALSHMRLREGPFVFRSLFLFFSPSV